MIKCCKGPIIDHYRPFNKIKKKTILHFVHSKNDIKMFRIQANICYHSTLQTMKHCLHLHRKMYSHFIKNNYYFTAASDMTWPVMPKTSLALGFNFCNINQNLKNQYFHPFRHLSGPIRKQEVIVCDLQMVDFNTFCVFLCFKVCCFWTSGLSRMFLKSAVSFI